MHRHEQLYASDYCGIMIDGDDDVRRYVTFDDKGNIGDGAEAKNDIGNMTNFGHGGLQVGMGSTC